MSRIHLSPPHMGVEERKLFGEAFDSNWIAPLGPHVDAFEREVAERTGVAHAAALSSGTAAIHLALRVLGVGPGDEVIAPTLTFSATINPILYQGARPVFLDSNRETWNLDPALLAEELEARGRRGRLPKAVIAVDLYGQAADYEPILAACERWGVPLVEDAAEALGATYAGRAAGSFGALGIFSFNGNKIITTSGGGMLLSNRREWIERARFLATQARDPAPWYQHSELGFNYRLSNLLAAVGRGQLRVLDQRVARRREINALYRRALGGLPGLSFMPEAEYGVSNGWLSVVTIDPLEFGVDREAVRLRLERGEIESRPVWKPMHLQPVFAGYPARGGAVATELFERGLCLPSGSSMTDQDVVRVAAEVRASRLERASPGRRPPIAAVEPVTADPRESPSLGK
jgi:pyridoxal phosphate-dependent aminotransferase EpsN